MSGLQGLEGLNAILSGGVAGALVTGCISIIYILLNKKVRTPADIATMRRAEIVDRAELLAEVRKDVADLQVRLQRSDEKIEKQNAKIDRQEAEINDLREEALERDHYIYRCMHVIQTIGSAADIPQPTPFNKDN